MRGGEGGLRQGGRTSIRGVPRAEQAGGGEASVTTDWASWAGIAMAIGGVLLHVGITIGRIANLSARVRSLEITRRRMGGQLQDVRAALLYVNEMRGPKRSQTVTDLLTKDHGTEEEPEDAVS